MGESVVEVHTSEGNLFLVNLEGPGGCITIQLTLTLKMTTAKVVETSVTVNNNSPIQDYVHPDDQTQPTFEMTPGFKPFTVIQNFTSFYITLTPASDQVHQWSHTHIRHMIQHPSSHPLLNVRKRMRTWHGRIFKMRFLVRDTATKLGVTTKRSNEK